MPRLESKSVADERPRSILIIGPVASGKSTLASRVARVLDLPVFHMDCIVFGPGWVQTTAEHEAEEIRHILEHAGWVIEGNSASAMDMLMVRADSIVVLDPPRLVRFWRVIYRAAKYWGRELPEMRATGCVYDFKPFWGDLYWGGSSGIRANNGLSCLAPSKRTARP